MAKKEPKSESDILRQKAESLLNKRDSKGVFTPSEIDLLRLVHELEVHQIELEMQNHELKLAHDWAKEAIEKYTELYNFAPVGYFTLSKDGEIIELNLLGAKMLGKVRSQLKHKWFVSFVSPGSQTIFNHFIQKIFQNQIKENCEITLSELGKEGIFLQASGVISESGKECLLTVSDITELKKKEKALMHSMEKLNKIADRVPGVVYQFLLRPDGSSCFPYASEAIRSIYGVSPDEVREDASKIFAVLHPDDCDMVKNSIQLSAKNLTPWQQEYRVKYADGTVRNQHGNALPQKEDDGSILWHGFSSDVTDRVNIQKELELKNAQLNHVIAEKDKFFSIVAHDLRGPFNGFLGLTQLLVEDLPKLDMDQICQMASMMKNSATNVFNLIENLLEWSRMKRGLTVFEPKEFNLAEKAQKTLVSVLESAGKKEIETVWDIPENFQVFADQNMFSSTLRNLVSNAVKFTPKGGKINLSARQVGADFIEISVKDNGIGLSKDLIGKLFDISEHNNRLGTGGEPSTGLGLLLCKEFIEYNGGKLWVESIEKEGSTFYFTTPVGGEE